MMINDVTNSVNWYLQTEAAILADARNEFKQVVQGFLDCVNKTLSTTTATTVTTTTVA